MAKRRMIDTRFWSDNFISDLNPLDRYLFLYFLTNEHTNISGIYEVPLKRISDETGIEKDMLLKMIKRLKGKIEYVQGWVAIKNFAKYQSDNESVKKGVENAKKLIPSHILENIDKIWHGGYTLEQGVDISELELEPKLELELEPKPKAEQSSAKEISVIIDSFKEVNPAYSKWFSNKTQRSACARLLTQHKLDKILKVITILPRTNKMPYMPKITTPLNLEDKWANLEAQLISKKSESLLKQSKVAFS